MDADKEGFLRSQRSLIQTIGRAARNKNGIVVLYAEKITRSMEQAINETQRRRKIQSEYNKKHNIKPQTIQKTIKHSSMNNQREQEVNKKIYDLPEFQDLKSLNQIRKTMKSWNEKMLIAAREKEFEEAAKYRDRVKKLKKLELELLSLE